MIVYYDCAQATTCSWLALTTGEVIAYVLSGVLRLHLKPGLRLITSRLATAVVVVCHEFDHKQRLLRNEIGLSLRKDRES